MPAFRIMTVDDDAIARRQVRGLIALDRECDLIGEAEQRADAMRLCRDAKPEIALVSTRLGAADGFELARALEPHPLTILTSAQPGDAVRAFEERALDFVLKPFEKSRVLEALRRAKAQATRDSAGNRYADVVRNFARMRQSTGRIAVRENSRVIFVSPEEIDWIEAADNYACLHCGKQTHVLRETMNELETRLDAARFIRIHRSAIVNIDRIQELRPWFRGDYRVVLRDGTELTLTKQNRVKLDSRLLLGSLAS